MWTFGPQSPVRHQPPLPSPHHCWLPEPSLGSLSPVLLSVSAPCAHRALPDPPQLATPCRPRLLLLPSSLALLPIHPLLAVLWPLPCPRGIDGHCPCPRIVDGIEDSGSSAEVPTFQFSRRPEHPTPCSQAPPTGKGQQWTQLIVSHSSAIHSFIQPRMHPTCSKHLSRAGCCAQNAQIDQSRPTFLVISQSKGGDTCVLR